MSRKGGIFMIVRKEIEKKNVDAGARKIVLSGDEIVVGNRHAGHKTE